MEPADGTDDALPPPAAAPTGEPTDDEAEMADEPKAVASNGCEAGREACRETSAAGGEDGCVGVGGTSGSGGPAGCTSCRR